MVDGGHLHEALVRNVGAVDCDHDRRGLVQGLLEEMERAYGVRFIKAVLHEATMGGRPTALASALSGMSTSSGGPIVTRTRPLKLKAGAAINPVTLEPVGGDAGMGGASLTMLVEAGLDVAMSLDVLRHASLGERSFDTIVVVTGNGDLGEVLDLAASSASIVVCAMRDAVAPSLLHLLPEHGTHLDELLSWAADKHVARRWDQPASGDKYKSVCDQGVQCSLLDNDQHQRGFLHPCSKRGDCEFLRRPGSQAAALSRGRLEHLSRFTHPCPLGGRCENRQEYHRIMWTHPATVEAERKQPISAITSSLASSSSAAAAGFFQRSSSSREEHIRVTSEHTPASSTGSSPVYGTSPPRRQHSLLSLQQQSPSQQQQGFSSSPPISIVAASSSLRDRQYQPAGASPVPSKHLDSGRFSTGSGLRRQPSGAEEDKADWGGRAARAAAAPSKKKRGLPGALFNPVLMGLDGGEGGSSLVDESEMMEVFRFAFHGLLHREAKETDEAHDDRSDDEDQEDHEALEEEEDGRAADPSCMFSMSL